MTRHRPLAVGLAGPLTGPRAAYGALLHEAARVDRGITLHLRDDRADPQAALAVAHDLVATGVSVVIGHFNSECARTVAPVYRAHGIPLLLPAATAPDLCQGGSVYRLCAAEPVQIDAMVRWLDQHGLTRVAVRADDSTYGKRLADAARLALGNRVLADTADTTSAQARLVFGSHPRVAALVLALKASGQNGPFLVCDDCSIGEFAELLGDEGLDEVHVALPYPAFAQTLADGLDLIAALDPDGDLDGQLIARGGFVNGERAHAGFTIEPVRPVSSTLSH